MEKFETTTWEMELRPIIKSLSEYLQTLNLFAFDLSDEDAQQLREKKILTDEDIAFVVASDQSDELSETHALQLTSYLKTIDSNLYTTIQHTNHTKQTLVIIRPRIN